ncbi:DUF934 domain-containing protein [Jiella sp. M17.18]|uniref:DUF934 domain-containing protein n=1 Tax=Jiella sp. M17.18 TaxID=3234247 RepID=UPI0034DEC884
MTLITQHGAKDDAFTRIDSLEAARTAKGPVILPLALAAAAGGDRPDGAFGLSVPATTPVEEIAPFFDAAEIIAVEFPSFSDGRGLSLARRLRRAGFTKTLRASGPLIADEFADVLACGFDEVELPETMANRQPVQQWMAAKDAITDHYQTGYGERPSILQQRLAARKGATP